ncbi:hypothetical protein GOP47_0006791 [Adiantum capillus-veneris]|uniref:Uncharacterized protein n=1 Tax=Adiantum capillus-veneris TaxID=13818 RepID=A0A9D4ZNC8_ADICA|nr:hypothetical protein GOP47_0006791 [Adiantum capillus-veneris]
MENDADEDMHHFGYDKPAIGGSSPIDIYSGAHSTSLESYTTEEEQVKCECCGLAEECTPAYIMRIRDMYCGKWVCGLCAEAVKEEHVRGQEEGAMSMADALHAHMRMCMQFNEPEKKGKHVADLAAAMTRLLRKSVDGSTSLRSAPSSPRRGTFISRANSCLSAFSPSQRYDDDAPL